MFVQTLYGIFHTHDCLFINTLACGFSALYTIFLSSSHFKSLIAVHKLIRSVSDV